MLLSIGTKYRVVMSTFFKNSHGALLREVKRILKQPILMVLMFVLPLISFLFFAVLFKEGVATNIPIAILDEDNSSLSRKITAMISSAQTPLVKYEIQDMLEGERLIREGKVMAVVQIPALFEKKILSNSQTHIKSYIIGTNLTANGLIAKDLSMAISTFNAGIQLELLTKKGLGKEEAMALLMPIRIDKHVLFNPYVNYGYYLSPSFMPMVLMIFTILATVFSIGTELKYSTTQQWLNSANKSLGAALFGKMLPIMASMFIVSLVMMVIMFKVVGVPLNGSVGLLMVSNLIFVVSFQSIGIFLISVLSNMRLAISLGGGYSVLAFTFSGLTFPIMAMHESMQIISRFFPFTYYTDIFIDQAMRGTSIVTSMPDICYMSLFILLPFLCLPRLHQICTNSKFWGRL